MATFLNTSATNYHLEVLIKNATERLILISPYLKLNDRMKELLEDKDRLKIDVRIVYGKSELQPTEIKWLERLSFVRTSFCKNLHAKCYLSEDACIITSLNLYEFSQVNNNEMGVLISRDEDQAIYKDAYEEAQRIIRISDEVRISLETVRSEPDSTPETSSNPTSESTLLTTSKLAKNLGKSTKEFTSILISNGYLLQEGDNLTLTQKGSELGAEAKTGRFGDYFVWPNTFQI